MRYWWVNQNQTFRQELRGNFMWSPKTNANGARNQFYENMRHVAIGDIVFSFRDTRIQAIGIATGTAQTAPKPDFGSAGLNWSEEGWFVPVYYSTFDVPIRPKEYIGILAPVLPAKYSPLQQNGDGLQSVYLAEIPKPMADVLVGLIGQPYFDALDLLTSFPAGPDVDDIDAPDVETDISPTFREQVVKARRGQGVFRSSVLLTEDHCRGHRRGRTDRHLQRRTAPVLGVSQDQCLQERRLTVRDTHGVVGAIGLEPMTSCV